MDDSFDLFGGLPTVGGGGGGADDDAVPAKATEASQTKDTTTTITSTKNTDNQPSNTIPSAANSTADDAAKSEALADKSKESASSLVSSIGTSGTKLAFVPQAIRKKKATKHQQPQKPTEHIPLKKRKFVGILETKIETEAQNTERNNIIKSSLDGQATAGLIASEVTWDNSNPHKTNDESQQQSTTHEQTTYPENNEPESLRLLHESVTNPYDPHCPNDYLAWRERKKTEQVRKDMQRTALQRLDQQEKMRKKIEEERKKILESGDFNKIVESQASREGTGGAGRGRGRGRGVANLPAWLVKKQQEQKADSSSASTKPIETQQFDD